MQINRSVVAPLGALLLFSSSALTQPQSQQMLLPTRVVPAPLDAASWRAIRLKNVPPSLVAWQLDGAHNVMPAFVNVPYAPPPKYEANYKEPERVKGPFDLPANVQLAASDEHNLLFVAGADNAQIARVQELVAILDQPLRSVGIVAQLVELPVAQLEQFGLSTDAATAGAPDAKAPITGASQVVFVPKDFQDRIDELVAAGTAKVVSTKPQSITNNTGLAVSLRFGPIDNTGANQNKAPIAPKEGSDTIITLTPTINGDDTITVLMRFTTLPTTATDTGFVTSANLRDGDTIALMGLKSSVFPGEAMNYKVPIYGNIDDLGSLFRPKTVVVMFVTARIMGAGEN